MNCVPMQLIRAQRIQGNCHGLRIVKNTWGRKSLPSYAIFSFLPLSLSFHCPLFSFSTFCFFRFLVFQLLKTMRDEIPFSRPLLPPFCPLFPTSLTSLYFSLLGTLAVKSCQWSWKTPWAPQCVQEESDRLIVSDKFWAENGASFPTAALTRFFCNYVQGVRQKSLEMVPHRIFRLWGECSIVPSESAVSMPRRGTRRTFDIATSLWRGWTLNSGSPTLQRYNCDELISRIFSARTRPVISL